MPSNLPARIDGLYRNSLKLVVKTWKTSPYRKYVLIASTVFAVLCSGVIILHNTMPANALVQPVGRLLYGDATNLGQIKLRVNTFDYGFNTEINTTPTSSSSHIAYIVSKAAPTRDEIIVGHLKVDGRLDVVKGTSGYDVAGDYAAAWNVVSNNAATCTGTTPADCTRTFDVAYEKLTGRAMVVYAGDTSDGGTVPDSQKLYYCYWDGTNWGPQSNCAPTNGTNDITLNNNGRPIFVELKSRAGTNQIMLVTSIDVSGTHEAEAWLWSGSSWGNSTTLTDTNNLVTATLEKGNSVSVEWESGNNIAVAAFGTDAAQEVRYKKWDGSWSSDTGGWDTNSNGADILGMNAETDGTSNRIAFATNSSANDAGLGMWKNDNSTEGFTSTLIDSTIEGGNGTSPGPPYTDVMWQASGSQGVVFAQNAGNTADPEYSLFTCTSTCSVGSVDSTINTSGGTDDGQFVRLIGSKNSNDIMALYADIDRNLIAQHWDGSAWEGTNAGALEADVSGATADTTTFYNMSATFQYVPYNIWQRNWRFYDDETVNNPTTGLNGAAENTTPTGVDLGEVIRLRANIYSAQPQAETDARKKLQFTSGCTPNSDGGEASCTWTDVGDTGDTGAVWRYATSGESCSSCSDNTAVSSSGLTGSTQSGWYTSDKDAAAGTNMDHNSQTILELDYPLVAQDVAGSTTYYFRIFDVQDNSAVYREQDNDGSNDCASATCTYPSLTTSAATITVSGGCFTDESEGAACGDAGAEEIKVAVNGTVDAGSDGTVDGSWSFSIAKPNNGDILVFFVNGEATEAEEATTVVKYDGAGNVDLVKMYQSQLVIGTDTGSANSDQTITVADLDTTTNGYENSDDEDVIYDVTAGADLTVDAESNKTEQIYIMNGDTFRPASGGGSDVTTAFLEIDTSATWTADSNAITVNGTSGTLFTNGGTFTQGTSTVNVTSGSGTPTFLSGATSFHVLTINAAATVINMGSAVTINAVNNAQLNVTSGVFNVDAANITGPGAGTGRELTIGSGGTLCLGGTTNSTSATCNSGATQTATRDMPSFNTYTFNSSSTVSYLSNVAQTISSTPTYGNLNFKPVLTAGRIYTFGGATTINGNFDINPDAASSLALTVNPAGTITVGATKTTTITRTGSNATSVLDTMPSATPYDLSSGLINVTAGGTLDAGSATSTITLTGTSGTLLSVAGTFTEGSSTVVFNGDGTPTALNGNTAEASTFNNLSLTPSISSSGRTYTFGTTALTVNGDFTIQPTGTQLLTVNPASNITVAAGKTTTITRSSTATSTLDLRPVSTDYNLTTGLLNVATGGTLDAGSSSSVITVNGTSGTLFTRGGTFTQGTSDVQITSGSGTPTFLSGATTFHKLTVNSAATVINMGSAVTINNAASADFTITTGVFNVDANNFSGPGSSNGTLTISAGAKLCLGGTTNSTNSTCNSGATQTATRDMPTFNAYSFSATSTVSYLSDAAQSVSSTPTYGNINFKPVLTSGRTYTLGGAMSPAGNFDINPDAASSLALTVNMAGTITIASSKTLTITRTGSNATSVLDTRPSSTDYNITAYDLTIGAGGTLDATGSVSAFNISNSYSNSGTFTAGSSVTTFSATDSGNTLGGTMTGSSAFYDLIFNGVGGSWTFNAAVAANNDLTVTNGDVTASNNNLTVTRDFTLANTSGVSYTAGSSTVTVSRDWNDTGNKYVRGTSLATLNGSGNLNTTGAFTDISIGYSGFTTTLNTSNFSLLGTLTFNGGTVNASTGGWVDVRRSTTGTSIVFASATTLSGTRTLYLRNEASAITQTIPAGNYGSWALDPFVTSGSSTSSTFQLGGDISTTAGVFLEATVGAASNSFNTQDHGITAQIFALGAESRTATWSVNFGASAISLTGTSDDFYVDSNGGSHSINMGSSTVDVKGNVKFANGTGTVSITAGSSLLKWSHGSGTKTYTPNGQSLWNLEVNSSGIGTTVQPTGAVVVGNNFTITSGTYDTVSGSNYALTIGGNYSNSGTFTAQSGTVTFNATDAGNTLSGTLNGTSSFFNIDFNGSGGDWTPGSTVAVTGDFTVTAGTVLGTQDYQVTGHVQGAGTINLSGGTFEQRMTLSGNKNFGTTSGSNNWAFNNLTFSNGSAICAGRTATTQSGGSGGITVAGILRIGKSGDTTGCTTTLNADNRTWTLSGTGGDPFQILASPAGDLSPSGSTFTYTGNNGSGDTTVQSETYNNLTVNNGSETYNLEGTTIAVDVTVSAGTLSLNSQTLQATDDLLVNGTLSGSTNVTVSNDATGTGTINLTGGTFLISDSNGGNFGTTGGSNNWTFSNLTFRENGDVGGMTITTQTGGSGGITVSSVLVVGSITDGTGTTLDAGNRTWTLSGTSGDPFQLVGSGPNLTPSSSTFTYTGDNGGGSTTVQSETYNILQINNGSETYNLEGSTTADDVTVSAGTLSLNGQTLQATNDLTVNGTLSGSTNVTVNGSISGSGTVSLSGGQFLQRISANANETFGSTSGSNNWTFSTLFFRNSDSNNHSITFNPTGSGQVIVSTSLTIGSGTDTNTLTLDNDTNDRIIDVNGSVTIASTAIFEPSSSASFTVADDWTNSGTFNHNNGTVTFDTTTTSTFNGATTFYGFSSTTPAKTLQFTAGQTFTIDTGGLLTLTGAADPNEIQIQSTSGSQWFINHQGSESVSFVQVINSGCDGASTSISTTDSVDDGNNGTCWQFGSDFSQEDFRFGQPSGVDIDYTGAPAENSAYTTSGTGDDFRLRMLVHVSGSNLAQNGNDFKLQFGEKTAATCDSGVSWGDVATGSGVIRYFDGGGRADGDNLTGNAGDPAHGAHVTVNQDYEEANNFTNSVNAINSGQDGEWDFSLVNNSAVGGKRYCFRIFDVTANDVLTAYNQYPEVIIDEELIFSLDSTSKDWGTINPGDNPTNQTSTLTTSTNSSTGYVVYAWTTQAMTLTNGFGTFTISDWTGTNGSPTAFNNGSFGFGYTTDDSSLTGGTADRFTNGGPFYAGFGHSGPGDPVADRTSGPVTSSSDQITYRLAAGTGQEAGKYETVVVYVASVTF